MILVYSRVAGHEHIVEDFAGEIYEQTGVAVRLQIDGLVGQGGQTVPAELGPGPHAISRRSDRKAKPAKKRFNKLMRKIRKKTKQNACYTEQSRPRSQIQKAPPHQSNCLICSEPFSAVRPQVLICRIHEYNPEALLKSTMPPNEFHHLFTTCGHPFHSDCVTTSRALQCPYCSCRGDFCLHQQHGGPNRLTTSLKDFMLRLAWPMSKYSFLVSPLLQTARVLNVVSFDRLQNNILPVLRAVASICYHAADCFWSERTSRASRVQADLLPKEFGWLVHDETDSPGCGPRTVCLEFALAKTIIVNYFELLRRAKHASRSVATPGKINMQLKGLIRTYLWRFAAAKLLRKRRLTLADIDLRLVTAECRDMLRVVWLVEQSLLLNPVSSFLHQSRRDRARYIRSGSTRPLTPDLPVKYQVLRVLHLKQQQFAYISRKIYSEPPPARPLLGDPAAGSQSQSLDSTRSDADRANGVDLAPDLPSRAFGVRVPGESLYETNSVLFYRNQNLFGHLESFQREFQIPHFCLICGECVSPDEIGRVFAA